jgi:hypothetical protein
MFENKTPFAKLARSYLGTLDAYREVKGAITVAKRIGHSTHDLEYEAARVQVAHQDALSALVDAAVSMRAAGSA